MSDNNKQINTELSQFEGVLQRDPPARIGKLSPEQRTPEVDEIFALFAGPGRINVDTNHVLNTFAQHPPLGKSFLTFNSYLLKENSLPVRLRQIVIMRTAWCQGGTYIWSSHLRTSLRNGLTDEVFDPIKVGAADSYWNDDERLLLQATDALLAERDLSDELWLRLQPRFSTQQIMDFIFTVGAYSTMVMATRSLRIDREDALIELAQKYGAP